jgi:hypothetical protein
VLEEPGPTFDPERLASALARLPVRAWALPVPDDVVNPGYQFAQLVVGGHAKPAANLFGFVLEAFAPVHTSWLARVPAGSFIGLHIDEGPYHERWHVPVVAAGTFDGRQVAVGMSFPVHHWRPHRVDNPTDVDRIHIVIDRDVWANVDPAPFQRIGGPREGQDEGADLRHP